MEAILCICSISFHASPWPATQLLDKGFFWDVVNDRWKVPEPGKRWMACSHDQETPDMLVWRPSRDFPVVFNQDRV